MIQWEVSPGASRSGTDPVCSCVRRCFKNCRRYDIDINSNTSVSWFWTYAYWTPPTRFIHAHVVIDDSINRLSKCSLADCRRMGSGVTLCYEQNDAALETDSFRLYEVYYLRQDISLMKKQQHMLVWYSRLHGIQPQTTKKILLWSITKDRSKKNSCKREKLEENGTTPGIMMLKIKLKLTLDFSN